MLVGVAPQIRVPGVRGRAAHQPYGLRTNPFGNERCTKSLFAGFAKQPCWNPACVLY
jgi:hypothetical protein